MLPVVGIAVLYVVPYTPKRLGIIAAFVTIFSFTLNMTTSAHMKEIFGTTAACERPKVPSISLYP